MIPKLKAWIICTVLRHFVDFEYWLELEERVDNFVKTGDPQPIQELLAQEREGGL